MACYCAFLRTFHHVSSGETRYQPKNIISGQLRHEIKVTACECSILAAPQRQCQGVWMNIYIVSSALIAWITLECMLRHAGMLSWSCWKCFSDWLDVSVCVSDLLPWNHGHIWQKEHATLHLLYTRTQVLSLFFLCLFLWACAWSYNRALRLVNYAVSFNELKTFVS